MALRYALRQGGLKIFLKTLPLTFSYVLIIAIFIFLTIFIGFVLIYNSGKLNSFK